MSQTLSVFGSSRIFLITLFFLGLALSSCSRTFPSPAPLSLEEEHSNALRVFAKMKDDTYDDGHGKVFMKAKPKSASLLQPANELGPRQLQWQEEHGDIIATNIIVISEKAAVPSVAPLGLVLYYRKWR